VNSYVDSAIVILGQSTETLYGVQAFQTNQILEVKKGVETITRQIERFEGNVKHDTDSLSGRVHSLSNRVQMLESQVEDVKSQVEDVKSQVEDVKSQVEDVKSQVEDVKSHMARLDSHVASLDDRVENMNSQLGVESARRANSMRKELPTDPIKGVSVLVTIGNTRSYKVPDEFPKNVREFWKLKSNSMPLSYYEISLKLILVIVPALVTLATHYQVPGWERWRQIESDDTDKTEYNDMSDAVADYPEICLRLLAGEWGLEYSYLPKGETLLRKRKAESDGSDSWRVRKREYRDETVESVISRDDNGQMHRQERITRTEVSRPIRDVREVFEHDPPMREQRPMSFESVVIGWRVGSSSTTDKRQIRDIGKYAQPPRDETHSGNSQ
jgi:chaperonin cofactor prefoldin